MSRLPLSLITTILLSVSISSLAQSPTLSYTYSYPYTPPSYSINGAYLSGSYYFNPSTHTNYSTTSIGNCTGTLKFTSSSTIWCLGTGSGLNKTYSLNLINSQANQITASYPIPYANSSAIPYLIPSGEHFLIQIVDQFSSAQSLLAFDTKTKEFSCFIPSLAIDVTFGMEWYTGAGFLFTSFDSSRNVLISFLSCNGDLSSLNFGKVSTQYSLIGFNHSSAFTLSYSTISNGVTSYQTVALTIDLENQIRLGQTLNLASVHQVSDSLIFGTFYQGSNFAFGVYTLNAQLQFVPQALYTSPLQLQSGISASPIIGTTQVVIQFGGQYIYDFNQKQIISAWGQLAPIYFNNGSVVNITDYGYTIQSPGEPIYFFYFPGFDIYRNVSDPTQVYIISIPKNYYNLSNACRLLHVAGSTNTIETLTFERCPIELGAFDFLQEVNYDRGGNPFVAYGDSTGRVYIVGDDMVYGELEFEEQVPQFVSVNLTAFTMSFLMPINQGTPILNFTTLYINNGSIINTKQNNGFLQSCSVTKINENDYAVLCRSQSQINLSIYDVWSFNSKSNIVLNVSTDISQGLSYIILAGGTPQGNSSYSGLAFILANGNLVVSNYQGKYVTITLPAKQQKRYVELSGSNSFFVKDHGLFLDTLYYYTVNNWGMENIEDVHFDKFLSKNKNAIFS